MSPTVTLERKQEAAIVPEPRTDSFKRELGFRALSAVFGAILGLCTPGLDQWYIAWFGLVPLLILIVTAKAPYQAAWRGFCLGTAYNLVCMNWYLLVRANVWSGNFSVSPEVMSLGSWILMSMHQGLFVGMFACILKALPLTGGWLPERVGTRWHLPSFVAAPLLWVLITDKIGNAPSVLGVPWTLLEYSQYKQLLIIQSACIIGGIGIGMAIVLANCTIAALMSFKKAQLRALTCGTRSSLLINCCISLLVLSAIPVYGNQRLLKEGIAEKMLTVSAIQSNLARMVNDAGPIQIVSKHLDLCEQCPPGLCVWPEWSLVVNRTKNAFILEYFAKEAAKLNQSWVAGTIDSAGPKIKFNSISALESSGKLLPETYHKRFLVPFGEFTPEWAKNSIVKPIFYGFKDPEETAAGTKGVVFKLKEAAVAPFLCWENLFPSIVAQGVRDGAEILVDCSNTGWFHSSMLSDQMVAFSVMRAVENHRSFVLATTLGPSTIVDSTGRILKQAPRLKAAAITAKVPLHNDLTFFTRWCF